MQNIAASLKGICLLKDGSITMNTAIKAGDRVRHKNRNISGGLNMPVEEISKNQALCIYLDLKDDKFKEGWFDLRDLELTSKSDHVRIQRPDYSGLSLT